MSENVGIKETPVMSRRPDEEDLAAFAEGRLDASMRDAVLERLGSDEDYHELYVELLRFQEEEADEHELPVVKGEEVVEEAVEPAEESEEPDASESADVLTSPKWWRRGVWAGLAAAAILAVWVAPRILYQPPTLEELVVGLEPNPEDLILKPGPTFRGDPEMTGSLKIDPDTSFLLGALLVDLEAADSLKAENLERERRADIGWLVASHHLLDLVWEACGGDGMICSEEFIETGVVDEFSMRYGMWSRSVWFALRSKNQNYLESGEVLAGLVALSRAVPDKALREEVLELRKKFEEKDLGELQDAIELSAARRDSAFQVQSAGLP